MRIEQLKEELYNYPIESLESLFKEIITQKKNKQREEIMRVENIKKLHRLLSNLSSEAEFLKKRWLLFTIIGCDIDEINIMSIVNNLTVTQLMSSKNIRYNKRKTTPIEETSEFQSELSALFAKIGPVAYQKKNQRIVKNKLERYYFELNKYYNKFGHKIAEPKFFNVILNGLRTKEIIPMSKDKNAIFNDILSLVN